MFITTRNNYTTLTKDIYLIKVLEKKTLCIQLDVIIAQLEFTLLPEEGFKEKDISILSPLNFK